MNTATMRRFPDYESLPSRAAYLGSTDPTGTIDERAADQIDAATAPVFFDDTDGTRHFFDLQPTP